MFINPKAFGGTEYMAHKFVQDIAPDLPKLDNYDFWILPGGTDTVYRKPNVLWLHNTPEQFGASDISFLFTRKHYTQMLNHVIVPSQWLKNHLLTNYAFEEKQITVIPNAIDPLTFNEKKYDVVVPKMIYISDSSRGLEMLLEAAKRIETPFELEIFTSMNPHIEGFLQGEPPNKWVIDLLRAKPNIKMYGRTNKHTLRQHIEGAHIFAYPSTYLETSCISLMEAMSAGLICVVSDKGALPETGKRYPFYFKWEKELNQLIDSQQAYNLEPLRNLYPENYEKNIEILVNTLEQALYVALHHYPKMDKQIAFTNRTYNWDRIKDLWIEWHDTHL